ncbi:RICIN domain-containing protein [Arthrobacter sp. AK01]|uniref:glycosyl hydrolase family 95 catalytic domain-containing protein n=1 Tax=Arthrobacter sp. AK01 TaxID=2894084 RepID=UPI001E42329A|nr:RICIN domain-containing protein [Arthrobacter sp. AK01]MCD4852623.1 RICIN domain-containing protein [Arthrobacter sp. AK01]
MNIASTPFNRRGFLAGTALAAGALAFPFSQRAAAAPPNSAVLPERGVFDTSPASSWTDGFLSGNGEYGAIFHGTPAAERVVLNHHRFVMPNGTRGMKAPDVADRLPEVQDKALAGDYWGAASTFASDWELKWTQSFHPGYELLIASPDLTTYNDYARTTNFRTGEVVTTWSDSAGSWKRRAFVSRASTAVVQELLPGANGKINTVLSVNTALEGVPSSVTYDVNATVSGRNGYLGLRGTYPAGLGAFGYEGVTRVVITGTGSSITSDGSKLTITNATKVILLTKLGRYESAAEWNSKPLHAALSVLLSDYDALLRKHTPKHQALFDSSSLQLNVSQQDRQLSTSELTSRQNANRSALDVALLERMYDSGRYLFASSSGILPPRLTGIWTGSWTNAWAGDFTTDANVNLQVAGGNILNHGDAMKGYFDLVLGQLDDWRSNAIRMYGARGFLAPTRTDGEHGHMLHFNGSDFPGQAWTGGADWMLYPLLEYYQVTGDEAFMRDKLGPALMELALFYEDYLSRTDPQGNVIFVPSFSMENSPSSTGQMLSTNATGEIMAGRHALESAILAANTLNREQGAGQGVARWTAMLGKLPNYTINGDEALAEWSWPGLTDRYNHRHVHHLYGAWPLHEINPEDKPELVRASHRALELRGDENYSAHGSLHRALAAARIKDGAGVYTNIKKVLGSNMVLPSLMTTHNPDLHIFNSDAANALPAIIAEALIYSRPGMLELLPALPEQLAKGTITGVRGRNRVLVENLVWDTDARTVEASIVSAITQSLELVCRRGINAITATGATLTSSSIGGHGRTLQLSAGVRTKIVIGLLPTTVKLVNRNSGKVMDVDGQSHNNGAAVIQWPWSGGANQKWKLVSVHDGSFRLTSVMSGKVLDNPASSTTSGQQLDQWSDTYGPNQWWRLVPTDNGQYYRLVNVSSGLCLDVKDGSSSNGARLVQATATGSSSQEWGLEPV